MGEAFFVGGPTRRDSLNSFDSFKSKTKNHRRESRLLQGTIFQISSHFVGGATGRDFFQKTRRESHLLQNITSPRVAPPTIKPTTLLTIANQLAAVSF